MTVSVIVPAYNSEKYIKRCLDSIINQTYKDLEIIIIDDYSTDNTKKIIKEYAEKETRIRPFYSIENKGVSFSRNIGLKASTGDYVIFVDSDDEITKDAIKSMVDISQKYNSDYVDSYQIVKYKNNKGKLKVFTENKIPKENLILGSIKENPKIIDMYMYIKGKLIKKNLIGDLLFDESLKVYEDLVFEQELKSKLKNYVMMNKSVYIYNQRNKSLINIIGEEHILYLESVKKVYNIYKDYNDKIKEVVEAMLFQNAVLTLLTKIIKNNKGINYNLELSKRYLNELINMFPDYENNKKINVIIKSVVRKSIINSNKLKKLIKNISKVNFVDMYFKYLAVRYKYKN